MSADWPLVSVVIPAFNTAAHIPRAIQSVLNQGYPRLEVLVVDDGSTDGTRAAVEAFGERVRYLRQDNAGPGAARNRGIRASRGPIIAFQDSDDEWLPGRLEKTLRPFEEDARVGMTFCHTILRRPGLPDVVYGAKQERERAFARVLWPSAHQCTPATTVRRAALDEAGLFEESLRTTQDRDLWIRIAEARRVVEIPEALVVSHQRRGSVSDTADLGAAEANFMRIIDRALARRPDLYEPHRALIMADAALHWGVCHLIVGRHREARRRLAQSLRTKFSRQALFYWAASFIPPALTMAGKRIKYALMRLGA